MTVLEFRAETEVDDLHDGHRRGVFKHAVRQLQIPMLRSTNDVYKNADGGGYVGDELHVGKENKGGHERVPVRFRIRHRKTWGTFSCRRKVSKLEMPWHGFEWN